MRLKEIASKLQLHPYTLKKWIKAGKIKATMAKPQHGGHDYYDISQEEFDRYINDLNN